MKHKNVINPKNRSQRQTDRQTDRKKARKTNRQTNRQTDRQTDVQICSQKLLKRQTATKNKHDHNVGYCLCKNSFNLLLKCLTEQRWRRQERQRITEKIDINRKNCSIRATSRSGHGQKHATTVTASTAQRRPVSNSCSCSDVQADNTE